MQAKLSSSSNIAHSVTIFTLNLPNPTTTKITTNMGSVEIPTKVLTNTSSQLKMPVVGMGSAPDFTCKKDTKDAIIEAIKQGYRHFDTAAAYGSEQALGEALKEAIELGLVTREELFVTSKLWVTENHPHLVIPALQKSLK